MSFRSWDWAVEAVGRFVDKPARLSHLLERLPERASAGERRRCQYLLFGVVRNKGLLEKLLSEFVSRRPRPMVWAGLLVASFELMAESEKRPLIVDNAVGRLGELGGNKAKGFANAVLRKAGDRLPELLDTRPMDAGSMAWRYSHPRWLVERWMGAFGIERTRELLEWNLREPDVFAFPARDFRLVGFESVFEPTEFGGYWRLRKGHWSDLEPLLREGRVYAQNPASGIASKLLSERVTGGRVLDLCAAPGGKTLALERLLSDQVERIVSVDLPGPRFERLQKNLQRCARRSIAVEGDLLGEDLACLGLFKGALLDAPCSNLGVLQRKVDAKWRLSPRTMDALPKQQLAFLVAASRMVAPSGALLYSLCSFDAAEGEEVVQAFLDTEAGSFYHLETACARLPGEGGIDGMAAYLMVKDGKRGATPISAPPIEYASR